MKGENRRRKARQGMVDKPRYWKIKKSNEEQKGEKEPGEIRGTEIRWIEYGDRERMKG